MTTFLIIMLVIVFGGCLFGAALIMRAIAGELLIIMLGIAVYAVFLGLLFGGIA